MTEAGFLFESIIKILAGALCGALLGFERKSHNRAIGMRTLILICVSSTLLSELSVRMALAGRGDPARIAAGVISGIGFLGGGAIMKQGMNIKGLTSAAIIWTAASFGLAIGAGLYVQVGIALALTLFLLIFLERVEAKWFPAQKNKTLQLCFANEPPDMKKLKEAVHAHGLIIIDMNVSRIISERQTVIRYLVKVPKEDDFSTLIESLKTIGTLSEFSIAD